VSVGLPAAFPDQEWDVDSNDPRVGLAVVAAYVALGSALQLLGARLPQWYLALLYFLTSKALVRYDKCTLSYLECKLVRGVPRERGLLNALLTTVTGVREYPAALVFMLCFVALVTWYHFVVRGDTLVL
jgi:hypothetical protein